MFRSIRLFAGFIVLAAVTLSAATASAGEKGFGYGRFASSADIAPWDIDVRYDGAGLPDGQGTIKKGWEVFGDRCAGCHGDFGEGLGRVPALFGGIGSLAGGSPIRRIGSVWPYAPTVFDYIRRAMPFGDAQSLTVEEVYSLTALILNMNDLWDENRVMNKANLAKLRMPNENGFLANAPSPDTSNTRCMRNCKKPAQIISQADLVEKTTKP